MSVSDAPVPKEKSMVEGRNWRRGTGRGKPSGFPSECPAARALDFKSAHISVMSFPGTASQTLPATSLPLGPLGTQESLPP